jgi:predicted regulator of amino acid metabolism with ACT domain
MVEIEAYADNPGILSQAAELISSYNISIRQAHAGDPELEEVPKLTIITEKSIPGELLSKFLEIKGVQKVSIY